jgi:hypothetical protein
MVRNQGQAEMRLSIERSRRKHPRAFADHGSRYDGGTATPIPVQERREKYGENILFTARRVG